MCEIAVSIIVPIYNAERHLKECLESCIHQTLESKEIICINDGSTDNTVKILNQYALKYKNIIILEQSNRGAGAARNLGLQHARGRYVAFMDSDDYYPDSKVVGKLYKFAIENKVKVCGGGALFLSEGKSQFDKENAKFRFEENTEVYYKNYQCSYGFTRYIYEVQFIKDNGITFPTYRQYEDPPFLVKCMIKAKVFYAISDVVYIIRNTDKIIRYDDNNVIIGILEGIGYILNTSKENGFEILHTDMVIKLMEYLPYVYKQIYRKNNYVRLLYENILSEVDEQLLANDTRHIKKPPILADNQINQLISESLKKEKMLMDKINLFKLVLIYGAGCVGRFIYDYIIKRGYTGRIEFVVSAKNVEYTACGKKVNCIFEYTNYKDDALMIIANQNDMKAMEKMALECEFKNIEKVSFDESKLFGADVMSDKYITIF